MKMLRIAISMCSKFHAVCVFSVSVNAMLRVFEFVLFLIRLLFISFGEDFFARSHLFFVYLLV